MASAGAAQAQSAGAPAKGSSGATIEEVVVTASRTGAQALQSAPIAVSVVSPDAISKQGKSGLQDFANQIPSVNFQSTSPGTNRVDMRGVTTTAVDFTNTQEHSLVAVYLDDTPISIQNSIPDLRVFDLERVEVIRGPQGTLYGAGSMAGTIRLITRKPSSSSFFGSVEAVGSTTDHGGASGSFRASVNVPVIDDKLAVSLAGYVGHDSGYIDNVGLNKKDVNGVDSQQFRTALRWTPTDQFTLDASVTAEFTKAHGMNISYAGLPAYTYTSNTPEYFKDALTIYNVTGEYNFDGTRLISSTSYLSRNYSADTSYGFMDEALLTPGFYLPAPGINRKKFRDFTQEVRLQSPDTDRFHWIVGVFYEQNHRYYPEDVTSPGLDAVVGPLFGIPGFSSTMFAANPNQLFSGNIKTRERQFAIFGEATYKFTPDLSLTVGLRKFDFRQRFNLAFGGIAGAIAPGQPLLANGTDHETGVNPRVNLSYKPNSNLLIFAEAAKGFRYGGVNEPVPLSLCAAQLAGAGLTAAPPTFGPDHLWSYTLGEKSTLLDGRLTANLTGFYIDWKDVQTKLNLSCGYYLTQNKGNVTSKGIEAEFRFKPVRDVTLGLNASYTDASANGPIPNVGAKNGDPAPFFPPVIATITADWRLPTVADLTLSSDYTYRSRTYTEFSPVNPLRREIPPSNNWNAALTYRMGRYELGAFVTNILDDKLISLVQPNIFAPFQPGDAVYLGRPRTVGARIRASF